MSEKWTFSLKCCSCIACHINDLEMMGAEEKKEVAMGQTMDWREEENLEPTMPYSKLE